MSTAQRTSRSIVANRFNQFASMYDPDAEPQPDPSEDGERPEGAVLPLTLGSSRYAAYRKNLTVRIGRCFYCKKALNHGAGSLDHVIPESRGGPTAPANLVLACQSCNSLKADNTPEEWLEVILFEIRQMQALADSLREKIEAFGLDYFPVGPKRQGKPRETPKPPKPTNADVFVRKSDMTPARTTYFLTCKITGKRILSNLDFGAAVHYVRNLTDPEHPVRMFSSQQLFNDKLGLPEERPEFMEKATKEAISC